MFRLTKSAVFTNIGDEHLISMFAEVRGYHYSYPYPIRIRIEQLDGVSVNSPIFMAQNNNSMKNQH